VSVNRNRLIYGKCVVFDQLTLLIVIPEMYTRTTSSPNEERRKKFTKLKIRQLRKHICRETKPICTVLYFVLRMLNEAS